jgi:SulP family sulfate permease
VVFAMARVKQELSDQLARSGFLAEVGKDRIYMTLPTAVAAYRQWYTRHVGALPEDLADGATD